MGEPARQLYGGDESTPNGHADSAAERPQLGVVQGGGETTPPVRGHLAAVPRAGIYDDQSSSAPGNTDSTPLSTIQPAGSSDKGKKEDIEPSDLSDAESTPKDVNYAGSGADKENGSLQKKVGEDEGDVPYKKGFVGSPTWTRNKVLGKVGGLMGQKGRKGRITTAIVGFVVAGGGMVAIGNAPSLGLIHIKETLGNEIGAVQKLVMRKRIPRVLAKTYFYSEEGTLYGVKDTGPMSWIKNRSTDKILKQMEDNGFKVSFENGKHILKLPGAEDVVIGNRSDFLKTYGATKNALNNTIEEAIPEGAFLRSSKQKAVARALGYSRANWLVSNPATRFMAKFTDPIEKFRAGFRGKLLNLFSLGDAAKAPRVSAGPEVPPIDENDIANAADNAGKSVADDFAEEAAKSFDNTVASIGKEIPETVSESAIKSSLGELSSKLATSSIVAVGTSALAGKTKAVNFTCKLNTVVKGAIVVAALYRFRWLVKYAGDLMPILDSVKSGVMTSAAVAGIAGLLLYSKSKGSGETPLGSTSWRSLVSGGRVRISDEEKRFAGVSTGKINWLTSLRSTLLERIGGACRVVTNPFIMIAAASFEALTKAGQAIAAPVTVGGTGATLAADIATSTALGVAAEGSYEIAKSILTPMAGAAIAGTTCKMDGGVKEGACLVSSVMALRTVTGATSGMTPLTRKAVAYYKDILAEEKHERYASMSIWERYFSFSNPNSLATLAVIQTPQSLSSFGMAGTSFLTSIPKLLSGSFAFTDIVGNMNKDYASAEDSLDPDGTAINDFGYAEMGIDPKFLDDEKYDLENTTQYLVGDLKNGAPSSYNLFLTLEGKPNVSGQGVKQSVDDKGNPVLDDEGKPVFEQEDLPEGKRKEHIKEIANKIEDYRLQCIDVEQTNKGGQGSNFGNVLINKNGDDSNLCTKDVDSYIDKETGEAPLRMYQMFRLDNTAGKTISEIMTDSYVYEKGQADIDGDGEADGGGDGVAPTDGSGFAGAEEATGNHAAVPSCKTIILDTSIVDNVDKLIQAAKADGISLCGWGGRSTETQVQLRIAHCGSSNYAIYSMPSSQCRPPTARPGRSMHEKFLAIDFTCNGGSVGRGSACDKWLLANAGKYGLKNLPSEAWHYSTNGN